MHAESIPFKFDEPASVRLPPDKAAGLDCLVLAVDGHRHRVVDPGRFEIPPQLGHPVVAKGARVDEHGPVLVGQGDGQCVGVAVIEKRRHAQRAVIEGK